MICSICGAKIEIEDFVETSYNLLCCKFCIKEFDINTNKEDFEVV